MMEQLSRIDQPNAPEVSESIRQSVGRSIVGAGNEKAPDFMAKFTAESDKMIQEGGKEFFNPGNVQNDASQYLSRFDAVVFETNVHDPNEV